MSQPSTFTQFLRALRPTSATFPDKRKGKNQHDAVVDAALGAFAVFFTQRPSFPAYPRDMTARQGQSNAHPLCGLAEIPSDNPMRARLDPVSPALGVPVFQRGAATLQRFPVVCTTNTRNGHTLLVHREACSQRKQG